VPNVAGDAVAVGLVGYALGPVAPCSLALFTRALPRPIHTAAVGFVSSAGASGGAAWPFVAGLVAQGAGTYVLHPICIALYAFMLGCWWTLAVPAKPAE
jgi:MFS family permease